LKPESHVAVDTAKLAAMSEPEFKLPRPLARKSQVKKASAASLGATILLILGYLVASWLGIPLDGLTSQGPENHSERPVAVETESPANHDAPTPATNETRDQPADATADSVSPFRIENITVRNLDGDVAFQGTVDLSATMQRIDAGRQLKQFRNDGSTFQNRERRLPNKARGYYKEYVHPTPRLSGPGPQRIVTGKSGEAYYTFDHYKTFQQIR